MPIELTTPSVEPGVIDGNGFAATDNAVALAVDHLKRQGVKYVLAQFVDIHGVAKSKSVPVDHLADVVGDGAGFAGFPVAGLGMLPHDPDFMARGELDTLSLVPWTAGRITWRWIRIIRST